MRTCSLMFMRECYYSRVYGQRTFSHPTWWKKSLWHNGVDHRPVFFSGRNMCVWISGESDMHRWAFMREQLFVCVSVHWHMFMHVRVCARCFWIDTVGLNQLWKWPSSTQHVNQACSWVTFSPLPRFIFPLLALPEPFTVQSWPGSMAHPCDLLSARTPVPQRAHTEDS